MQQLQTLDLINPGVWGLNLESQKSLLRPEWASQAFNAVIDSSGRLASRQGYSDVTTTEITSTPAIKGLFEYLRESGGTTEYIVSWDGGIGNSIDDPENNDISGAVTDSDGNWWFQNFNDRVIGFISGQKPVVYSAGGSFATVSESSGTAPTVSNSVGFCGFGRVWSVGADRQTIAFTALLDETDWGGSGAGTIDMQNIWTKGTDEVMAITAFNGALVVFGKRHIVMWVDGSGNQLGLDPAKMYVADILEGVGTISQWSIQALGEADLLFVSQHGLQSLRRVLSSGGSAPLQTLSQKVASAIGDDIEAATADEIRSAIDPLHGLYLITLSSSQTWVFSYRRPFRDPSTGQTLFPVTRWDLAPTAWLRDTTGTRLLFGGEGNVYEYAGLGTDAGNAISFVYESGWLDLGEQIANRIKILKRISGIFFVHDETNVVLRWRFDFSDVANSRTKFFESDSVGGLWDSGLWGTAVWGGVLALRQAKVPAGRQGRYLQVGVTTNVTSQFSLQQLELLLKIGRMA